MRSRLMRNAQGESLVRSISMVQTSRRATEEILLFTNSMKWGVEQH